MKKTNKFDLLPLRAKLPLYFYPEEESTAIDVLQEERDDDLIDDAEAGFMAGYMEA